MNEKELLAEVRRLARSFGWRVYHTRYSLGSDPGWPDLVLVRDRIIFAELKGPRGQLSLEQQDWLDALKAAGGEVYVWREDDLEEIVQVLSNRIAHN